MKKTRKVYVVVSDKDICGDVLGIFKGKQFTIKSIYDYACLAVFEKRTAALNWKKECYRQGYKYKIVSATLRLGGLTKG